MRFAQRLPVVFTPEQMLCFRYRLAVASLQRVFQFVWFDVVYNRGRCDPSLLFTHHTQRMLLQESQVSFIPSAAVDAGFFHIPIH